MKRRRHTVVPRSYSVLLLPSLAIDFLRFLPKIFVTPSVPGLSVRPRDGLWLKHSERIHGARKCKPRDAELCARSESLLAGLLLRKLLLGDGELLRLHSTMSWPMHELTILVTNPKERAASQPTFFFTC